MVNRRAFVRRAIHHFNINTRPSPPGHLITGNNVSANRPAAEPDASFRLPQNRRNKKVTKLFPRQSANRQQPGLPSSQIIHVPVLKPDKPSTHSSIRSIAIEKEAHELFCGRITMLRIRNNYVRARSERVAAIVNH